MSAHTATALAHPNIALAKYWGKRSIAGNVPATPSVSVTLGGLDTRTTVTFDEALTADVLSLDGVTQAGRPLARVTAMLDELRALAGTRTRASVSSVNGFPTASGLASSASGFAALARAGSAALRLSLDDALLSRIARRASASAARSVLGGFVALGTEDDAAAEPVAAASHWSLAVVVAAATLDAKPIGSTEAMERTRTTSPFYAAWLEDAPALAAEVRAAILARDLQRLGEAAEASAMRMHACALAARPAIAYWTPPTLALLAEVRALRARGLGVWATIDAGPHVKALCSGDDAARVDEALHPWCVRTFIAHPGEGARVIAGGAP